MSRHSAWLRMAALAGMASVLAAMPALAAAQADDPVRAQLVSRQSTVLSAELPGRIVALPRREGEAFKRGDLLAGIDCEMHRARLQKAQAQLQEAAKIREVNTDLDRFGSVSKLELEVSGSRVAVAEAEVGLMKETVKRCQVFAPFAGKVVERLVKPHQFVAEGQQMLAILDDSSLDVEMLVPSNWLAWLKPGRSFSLKIDETGKVHEGQVTRVSPQLDPVSQSVKVYGQLGGAVAGLSSGMSGAAVFRKAAPGGN